MTDQAATLQLQEFEREKLCFEQNSEHLRALNGHMWQVPLIAMTMTGGIWYGIAQLHPDSLVILGLLILVTTTDFLLIFVMIRMRYIFGRILEKTREFYPAGVANTRHWLLREGLVLGSFSFLLFLSSSLSLYGACNYHSLLKMNEPLEVHLTADRAPQDINVITNPPKEEKAAVIESKSKKEKQITQKKPRE